MLFYLFGHCAVMTTIKAVCQSGLAHRWMCLRYVGLSVFHFVYNSLECFRVVEGEVGENLAVNLNAGFVYKSHEL